MKTLNEKTCLDCTKKAACGLYAKGLRLNNCADKLRNIVTNRKLAGL